MKSGAITLNENNPLGLSHFDFSVFNRVGDLSNERMFNVALGSVCDLKVIYDYMIANNYLPQSMQLTPENIAKIKDGTEPEATYYRQQFYPLAGGINGGWIFCYNNNRLGFYCLSDTDVMESTAMDITWTLDNVEYNSQYYMVDEMYYNGVVQTDGFNRGWIGSPFIIERYETSAGAGGIYTISAEQTADSALMYSGADLWVTPIIRRNPNIVQFSNGLRSGVEWWFDYVSSSDLKYDNDPQGDSGYSEPDGANGTPQSSIDIPISPLPPSIALQAGIIRMYLPTTANMKSFIDFVYSAPDSVITNLKKIWANPMDSIISLGLIPYLVNGSGASEIVKFCGVSTEIEMEYIENQYFDVDCGYCYIFEEFCTLLDYNNYTRTKLFLPFIGIVEINTDDVMGGRAHLVYHCDLLSGECVAELEIQKSQPDIYNIEYNSVIYSYKGNILTSLPITGNNWQQLYSGVLNLASAIMLPSPASVAGVASDILGQKVTVQRSGNLNGNGGALGSYMPYFIFEKAIRSVPEHNAEYVGYPLNKYYKLGSLTGYTEIETGTFRTDKFTRKILDEEAQELLQIMEGGIIL